MLFTKFFGAISVAAQGFKLGDRMQGLQPLGPLLLLRPLLRPSLSLCVACRISATPRNQQRQHPLAMSRGTMCSPAHELPQRAAFPGGCDVSPHPLGLVDHEQTCVSFGHGDFARRRRD
jgi:hypothetical protein